MPAFFGSVAFRLIAIGTVFLIVLIAVTQCSGQRQKAAQAGQDARSATATAETAKDAARTVIDRSEADASIDDLVAETTKEIENAETPEAAGNAARAAICRMPNYSADPACKLR